MTTGSPIARRLVRPPSLAAGRAEIDAQVRGYFHDREKMAERAEAKVRGGRRSALSREILIRVKGDWKPRAGAPRVFRRDSRRTLEEAHERRKPGSVTPQPRRMIDAVRDIHKRHRTGLASPSACA